MLIKQYAKQKKITLVAFGRIYGVTRQIVNYWILRKYEVDSKDRVIKLIAEVKEKER